MSTTSYPVQLEASCNRAQSRALACEVVPPDPAAVSTNAAAAHNAVIAAERKLVTTQFTHLLGHDPTRRGAGHGVTLVAVDGATRP
jgi:hypothetical protein